MTTAVANSGPDESGPEFKRWGTTAAGYLVLAKLLSSETGPEHDSRCTVAADTYLRWAEAAEALESVDLSLVERLAKLSKLNTQAAWRGKPVPGKPSTYASREFRDYLHAVKDHDRCPDVVMHDISGEHPSWVIELKQGTTAQTAGDTEIQSWLSFFEEDDFQAYRMVPASKATLVANEVQNQQEMGAALRMLREDAGLSIGQLADKVKPLNIAGVGRSTVGRVMAGGTLCATEEALVALVKACGVADADVPVWVAAWERARAGQKRRGRRPAAAATPEVVELEPDVNSECPPTATVVQVDADEGDHDLIEEEHDETGDDEVIGTVQITRGHLRAAVVLSAIAGAAAMSSQAPGMRNAGGLVLGLAGVLALLDTLRASTTPRPAAVSAAA